MSTLLEKLKDKLLDSYVSSSRQVLAVYLLVCVISIYLIQRSLSGLLDESMALKLTEAGASQVSIYGLNFSFLTMSVVWPLVLGIICRAFMHLLERHRQIGIAINAQTGENQGLTEMIDPIGVDTIINTKRIGSLGFLDWLPLIAITMHLVSFAVIYMDHYHDFSASLGRSRLWFLIALQFFSLVLAVIWINSFTTRIVVSASETGREDS